MNKFTCPGCGRDDKLYRNVSVAFDTELSVRIEERDGKPYLRDDDRDLDWIDVRDDMHKSRTVYCECGAEFKNADELRAIFYGWQPGDVAILPDGLRGEIESVEGDRLMIVGWHETFLMREVSPVNVAQLVAVLA